MAEIKAIRALRFTQKAGDIKDLTCPPYDIISESERQAYLQTNPYNIIRLELPKEGTDPYATAGETLKTWMIDGVLAQDATPGLYIYEQLFTAYGKANSIKGFVCGVRLEEWENGVVLPHEETLSKAKADRFNLMCATGVNFSSVYSLYFDEDNAVFSDIEKLSEKKADIEFTAPTDGTVHRIWKVEDRAAVAAISKKFADKKLYIADGHHRYETAINYRNHLREQGVVTNGEHPANFVMMTLMNMENPGLVVFPTHRIVRNIENFDAATLLKKCGQYFDIERSDSQKAMDTLSAKAAKGEKAFALCHQNGVEILTLKDQAVMDELLPGTSKAYRELDVNILHKLVLERLFDIDKENMANQKNLIYTRSAEEALAAVVSQSANCAFLINPTRVDEIAAVAGAGEKMPQKSTYFYPKLITGHVINPLNI